MTVPDTDILAALKQRLRVRTDEGLAKVLGVARSTVTSWRRRGSIPDRYARLVDPDGRKATDEAFNFAIWSDAEKAALSLALMRMHKGYFTEVIGYSDFLARGGFFPVQLTVHMDKALRSILAEMEERRIEDAFQCLNMLVYEEFFE